MDDPIFASAHKLASAIQSAEVSSTDIVDAYLAQIAHHNPKLNAVVTLDEEGALRGDEHTATEAGAKQPHGHALYFFTRRAVKLLEG
ncbi:MAG: hypothetical protein M3Q62_09905 [Actinomycetota bacterium]|jgi:amidase|nr:hypothetical protein [Rubrobacteraceae bacterium]MBA3702535.1 hypothetical protein [Rubrobacteraceae bacterium]MDQ3183832.1 hypothetical protein [Actinomycetota bacterium]